MSLSPKDRPIVIAHRGRLEVNAQENSMATFEKAIQANVDLIETDLKKTKDGVLILFHDSVVEEQRVDSLTYRELQERSGLAVPTLEEFLRLVDGKVGIDLDVKDESSLEEALDLFSSYHKSLANTPDFILTSFRSNAIRLAKEIDSSITTGLLVGAEAPLTKAIQTRYWELFKSVDQAVEVQADYVLPHFHLAKAGLIRKSKEAGLPLIIWTVNFSKEMERFFKNESVKGIVTDNTTLAEVVRESVGNN